MATDNTQADLKQADNVCAIQEALLMLFLGVHKSQKKSLYSNFNSHMKLNCAGVWGGVIN